jgi:hypothetical protein
VLLLVSVLACGPNPGHGDDVADSDGGGGSDGTGPCSGLRCQVVDCNRQSAPPTSLSGTVFAPNGTLALYGVTVYVPNEDPGPMPAGLSCDQCKPDLPGDPITKTKTNVEGKFVLTNVPSGTDIPLVIQIGKWRRQIKIANVAECTDNALPAADTSLPKTQAQGDIPQIAITTGSYDALECLVKKLGIDDTEFVTAGGTGKVHLYEGNGAKEFASGFGGGSGTFANATTLWSDANKLKSYDIAMFSCEGAQNPTTKPQASMDAVKGYADLGGRLFLSHWHNVWIEGAGFEGGSQKPAVWPGVATWNNNGDDFTGNDTIDETNNPKGKDFADWMVSVGGSATRGQIAITDGRQTVASVNESRADRWVFKNNIFFQTPQNFQFTTPNEAAEKDRCGKVVFSDMHVASGSTSAAATPFPGGCSTAALTPQEKALAFMFFDIASCVESPVF